MALVKGPNGLVYDWPEALVASLVLDGSHERVEAPKPGPARPTVKEKPAPRRRSSTAKK